MPAAVTGTSWPFGGTGSPGSPDSAVCGGSYRVGIQLLIAAPRPGAARLMGRRAGRIIPRVNCLAVGQQRVMPVSWRAVIGEGVQARVTRAIGALEGEGAPLRIPDRVVPSEVITPLKNGVTGTQSLSLRARMVLWRLTVPPWSPRTTPPPLSAIVVLSRTVVPKFSSTHSRLRRHFSPRYCS